MVSEGVVVSNGSEGTPSGDIVAYAREALSYAYEHPETGHIVFDIYDPESLIGRCGVGASGGAAMTPDRCPAEKPILHCCAGAGHDGPHRAVTLDSDDNAITERWYADSDYHADFRCLPQRPGGAA